jgi:hypothetical protein
MISINVKPHEALSFSKGGRRFRLVGTRMVFFDFERRWLVMVPE